MTTQKNLYRGMREKVAVLTPQPLLEDEKDRFPEGTESVVYATEHRQEALGYAIASRQNIGSFTIVPYWQDKNHTAIGWKLELGCAESDIPKEDKTFLYELAPEGFVQNTEGEWYSTKEVFPVKTHEMIVGEALQEFDEVKFWSDPEIRIVGEGNDFAS